MVTHLNIVCKKYEYALVELHYNNGFLIFKEVSPSPSLTPEEAYKQRNIERLERNEKYPLANPLALAKLFVPG